MTFDRPPLNEVVLSLQSDPVEGLTTPFLGLFWNRVRGQYPSTQVLPTLDPVIEKFDPLGKAEPTPAFRFLQNIETPRCWFLADGGSQLIQLQQDRVILNWRKTESAKPYPRYEHLRPEFERVVDELGDFLNQERLGALAPNQCEISYINHIEAADWKSRGELHKVLSFWTPANVQGLQAAEDANTALRFVIEQDGERLGRLHVTVKSAIRRTDGKPVLVLDFTARGRPVTPDISGVVAFLDLGREWIHKAFRELTSREAQRELWGLRDE